MKHILLLFSLLNFYLYQATAQVTLEIIPETPLTYLAYELSTPAIKAGYSKRTNYFGQTTNFPTGSVSQTKYTDLPIYSFFKEEADFFSTLQTMATATRTTDYVSYIVQVRETSADPYVLYAKDTFFLSGTTITSVSETIYDTETNSVKTEAEYDVLYHSNGRIKSIQLKDYSGYDLHFAGVSVVYNPNNTIASDTTYSFGFNENGERKAKVSFYHNNYYNSNNPIKPDSSYYYDVNRIPQQAERLYYITNSNNEIIETKFYTYNAQTLTYDYTYHFLFGEDLTLRILSNTKSSDLHIFPNPVQDALILPNDVNCQSWAIMNLNGKIVKQGADHIGNRISVSELEPGFYILNVEDGQGTRIVKFLK